MIAKSEVDNNDFKRKLKLWDHTQIRSMFSLVFSIEIQ